MTGFWCFMLAMELLIPLAMPLVGRPGALHSAG